ncbi:response regulator [Geotalea toluenoxydans]|uniref:response regulator n=1 Tax=Geotalea toluenoxydans TaxID=421624 RepID=UPI0006D10EA3|nr:response regulator [Geotalea toluenoxydans]
MDGNSACILLIEDNSGDALLIIEMLSEFPGRYEVTRASRFSAAFELLERNSFDLVIMDLNLPMGTGLNPWAESGRNRRCRS